MPAAVPLSIGNRAAQCVGSRSDFNRAPPTSRETEVSRNGTIMAALVAASGRPRENRQLQVWDFAAGGRRESVDVQAPSQAHVAVSPDGSLVAVQTTQGVEVRAAKGLEPLKFVPFQLGNDERVTELAFAPDGEALFIATFRAIASVETAAERGNGWGVLVPLKEPEAPPAKFRVDADISSPVVLLPNRRAAVWIDEHFRLRAINLENGRDALVKFPRQAASAVGFDLNADGTELFSLHEGGIVRHWKFDKVVLERSLSAFVGTASVFPDAKLLRLDPTGDFLVIGTQTGSIAVLDAKTYEPLSVLGDLHSAPIAAFAFSPESLVAAADDGRVSVWSLQQLRKRPARSLIERACDRVSQNMSLQDWRQFFPNLEYHPTCAGRVGGRLLSTLAYEAEQHYNSAQKKELTIVLSTAGKVAEYSRETDAMNTLCYYGIVSGQERLTAPLCARGLKLDLEQASYINDARKLEQLCRQWTIAGHPRDVLGICDRAVTMEPDSPQNRDSRGVARAMCGDPLGAREDFDFVRTHSATNSEVVAQRGKWISEINAGRNPITRELLPALRGQEFAVAQ